MSWVCVLSWATPFSKWRWGLKTEERRRQRTGHSHWLSHCHEWYNPCHGSFTYHWAPSARQNKNKNLDNYFDSGGDSGAGRRQDGRQVKNVNGSLRINGRAGDDEKEVELGHQRYDPWGAFIHNDQWKWKQIKSCISLISPAFYCHSGTADNGGIRMYGMLNTA